MLFFIIPIGFTIGFLGQCFLILKGRAVMSYGQNKLVGLWLFIVWARYLACASMIVPLLLIQTSLF